MPDADAMPPALIALRAQIDQAVKDGTLDLTAVETQGKVITLLKKTLGVSSIPLRASKVGWSADGTGIMVAGQADLGGGKPSDLRVKFTPDEGRPAIELTAQLTEPLVWKPDSFPLELAVTAFAFSSAPGVNFALTLWAQIGSAENPISLSLELPTADGDWMFTAAPAQDPVTLADVARLVRMDSYAAAFPWSLDAAGLTELALGYRPGEGISYISVACATTNALPLIEGMQLDRVLGRVTIREPGKANDVDLQVTGLITIGSYHVLLQAHRWVGSAQGATWTFRGSMADVNLSKLVQDVATAFSITLPALPPELPELEFKEISVEFTPKDGSFTFHAETDKPLEFPKGGGGVSLAAASFSLSRKVVNNKPTHPFSIKLKAEGQLSADPWPEGLEVKSLALEFSHDGTKWAASGDLVIDLFDAKNVHLGAQYLQSASSTMIILTKGHADDNAARAQARRAGSLPDEADLEVLAFTDQASLKIHDVTLTFERDATTDPDKTASGFSLDAGAHLTVQDKVDLEGRLRCAWRAQPSKGVRGIQADGASAQDTGIEFALSAQQKPLTISAPDILASPGKSPTLAIHAASIKFGRTGAGPWSLKGSVTVSLESFPERIQSVLPPGDVTGTIKVDHTCVKVSIDKVIADVPIKLPALPLSGAQLDDLKVNAYNPTVTVDYAGGITFSLEPTIKLPANINAVLFGKNADRVVFATDAAVGTKLTLGMIKKSVGAEFALTTSPFAAFKLEVDPKTGESYLPCDLGPAGLVRIGVPVFAAGAGGFTFEDGFQEDAQRPLALPLTPFKALLGQRLGDLAAVLPDSIPLLHNKPKLFSDGKLVADKLITYIEEIGRHSNKNFELPPLLKSALADLGKAASGLPTRLIEYLQADLPSGLHFKATANESGSVTVDLTTQGAPIMVLLPAFPNIIGLCIHSLSFGPILGGSLFLLKLNAKIDVFDPAVIAGAVVAAEGGTIAASWLPDAKSAHHTIIIEDLVMFIVYETVVPIPIPLFFENLGIDSVGPAGLAIKASVSFNPLRNDFGKVFTALHDLYDFVKDPAKRLPPKGALDLHATIGETYLQLPPFLGAKTYGAKGAPLADVDLYALFANVLNGIKFFSLPDFLQGIPLEYRCGTIDLSFGPLAFAMYWAATTRKEFGDGLQWRNPAPSNRLAGLPPKARAAFLALVPAPRPKQGDDDSNEGLVVMLAGKAGIAGACEFDGQFAMMTARRSGFASGLQLRADFANNLTCMLTGTVAFFLTKDDADKIQGSARAQGLTGSGTLRVGDHVILAADTVFTGEEISFSGKADLFPNLPALVLQGDLRAAITAQGFLASGRGAVSLFGVTSATEQFTVTDQKFQLQTTSTLPCCSVILTVTATTLDPASVGKMTVTGHFEETFSPLVIVEAVNQARAAIVRALDANIHWAEHGLNRDLKQWPWNQEHFPQTWAACIAIYAALKVSLSNPVGDATMWAFNQAVALLPTPVAQGIRWLSSGADSLFDRHLAIDISGDMDTCLQGNATVTVSGKYAGLPFGPIAFRAPLGAGNLATIIAQKIVATIFRV